MPQRDIDDPDLVLADLFREWPEVARVFIGRRMGCVGCLVAPFHHVADACAEYGLDEAEFRAALRKAVSGRAQRARVPLSSARR